MTDSWPDGPGEQDGRHTDGSRRPPGRGWPRGRVQWLWGSVALLVIGAIVGLVLGSIWLGLMIAAIVSIGWIMAYESWRGRTPDMYDEDDDGARL